MRFLLVFILSAFLMFTFAYNPYDSMVCLDCGDECVVHKRGASCKMARKNLAAWKSRIGKAAINTSHLMCVPNDLRLKEVDPAFCCLWAPEFGCRLVRSILDDHIHCRRCINPKRKRRGYTLCPCRGYHGRVGIGLVVLLVGVNIMRQMS